jgi:hypothetical protein
VINNPEDIQKELEVELLKSSISHLQSAQQTLQATATAAKERKRLANPNPITSLSSADTAVLSAPPSSALTAAAPATEPSTAPAAKPTSPTEAKSVPPVPSTTSEAQKSAPEPKQSTINSDHSIELQAVVNTLNVSVDCIATEEFHGIHSK